MKLERLMAILVILINRRLVQAKELAERFEVSVRTIYRDIDALNQAGIPIITYQGAGGGIGLANGYRLDRNVLTNDEFAAIVTALRSLSTATASSREAHHHLVDKINSILSESGRSDVQAKTNQLIVDHAPWGGQHTHEDMQRVLKQAIEQLRLVRFIYHKVDNGQSSRIVEPHTLVLKGQHWYVYAYCLERASFRLFKLTRISGLAMLDTPFDRRELPGGPTPWDQDWYRADKLVELQLRFLPPARQAAMEVLGTDRLQLQPDGSYIAVVAFPEDNWVYRFILGFGEDVEVLSPPRLRNLIRDKALAIANRYKS